MIFDILIPVLEQRFPGRGAKRTTQPRPCITFPAIHPEVGDLQIYDDGDEVTLIAGNFTHGHFSNYDDIAKEDKERMIAADVADFLEKLFSDQVVFWGSHKGRGGWRVVDSNTAGSKKGEKEYVWSGPKKSS